MSRSSRSNSAAVQALEVVPAIDAIESTDAAPEFDIKGAFDSLVKFERAEHKLVTEHEALAAKAEKIGAELDEIDAKKAELAKIIFENTEPPRRFSRDGRLFVVRKQVGRRRAGEGPRYIFVEPTAGAPSVEV